LIIGVKRGKVRGNERELWEHRRELSSGFRQEAGLRRRKENIVEQKKEKVEKLIVDAARTH